MVEISLRGLMEVASDILSGIFQEISTIFEEGLNEMWDLYDTITPG